MKQKFLQAVPFILVFASVTFSRLTADCARHYSTCNGGKLLINLSDWLTDPLYFYSLGFALGAFILLFIDRTIFNKWLRFAVWWVPISIVLIAITPSTSGQWLPLYFIGKSLLALILGGIFSLITIVLVWKRRSSKA